MENTLYKYFLEMLNVICKARIRLEIEIKIGLEFNQSKEKKTNLKFSKLCFDSSKSNLISIPISDTIIGEFIYTCRSNDN